jgi:hypothetical protein
MADGEAAGGGRMNNYFNSVISKNFFKRSEMESQLFPEQLIGGLLGLLLIFSRGERRLAIYFRL